MTVAGGTTASDHSAVHCNDALNVADGSFASIEPHPRHVSFTPDSGSIAATQRNDAMGHKKT